MSISKYLVSSPKRIASDGPDAPKPIVMCQVIDCTTFYPPRVDGKERKGQHARADVIFSTPHGHRIALCCYHYDIALYKAGKGRMSEITGRGVDLIHADIVEHWKRLDIADAAAKAKAEETAKREYARLREGFST